MPKSIEVTKHEYGDRYPVVLEHIEKVKEILLIVVALSLSVGWYNFIERIYYQFGLYLLRLFLANGCHWLTPLKSLYKFKNSKSKAFRSAKALTASHFFQELKK